MYFTFIFIELTFALNSKIIKTNIILFSITSRHPDAESVPFISDVPTTAVLAQLDAVGHAVDVRAMRPTAAIGDAQRVQRRRQGR